MTKKELKHRKAATDAPNLRGSSAYACWNCKNFKGLEGAYPNGLCEKHQFDTEEYFVCDDHEKRPPEPMLVAVVEEMKSMLCSFGSEVKAQEDGKVSGYLVRFSDASSTDLSGDYFTSKTDFGEHTEAPIYFHHGLDPKVGARKIGTVTLKTDEVGVWVSGILEQRDAYEKAILKLAQKGKLGWSSGTAPHLVKRKSIGTANEILSWPLGLDASLTHTPAEPRNGVEAKSLKLDIQLEPEADAEAGNGAPAGTDNKTTETGETEMTKEEQEKLVADQVAAELKRREDEAKAEAEAKAKQDAELKAAVEEGVKAELAKRTAANGGLKLGAPAITKTKLGDDAFKAFGHYLATGDAGGIRTGDAYDRFVKTDYHLLEGTQYQGQEAVPTEVYAGIVEKRNASSVARAAGAMVIQAKSNAINVPVEKAAAQAHGTLAIDGTNTFTTMTSQPLDKLAMTIYTFTYNLPIDINLLDDSVFDIEGWGNRRVGRGLALTENTYMLMGTGSSQPQGAIYSSTKGIDAASATAVTAAEIVKLYYTVAAEYRDKMAWVMAPATEAAIRNLESTKEFPFVGNGGANGGVGTGSYPNGGGWLVDPRAGVFTSSACDALAASKKVVMVGNFEAGFAIADRKYLTVLRDPYSEASKGIVNLWFYSRWSSGVTNADALQHILTPTG